MTANDYLLPKEAIALVQHIELNRAGWWDKSVHRLLMATIWLSDNPPNADTIQAGMKATFKLYLPELTGRAIAAYLKYERPKSQHREVFVRQMAPHDEPIGPDLVRKTIRQAYERAGLPYTGSHLLRHTIARRLLDGGCSLKEVADVLRHRSLNTTLIYAKLDSRNLRSVAMPWPGRGI